MENQTTEQTSTVNETAAKFFDNSPEVKEETVIKEDPKPTEEAKPTEEKPDEVKPTEEIEYKLEKTSEHLTDDDVSALKELAKETKLTNEQAQKFLSMKEKTIETFAQRQLEQFKETTKKWVEDVKSDKELGGQNLSQTLQFARRAIDEIASPALKKILDDTGYGNHPELVRAFARLGKRISSDKMVQAPKSPAAAKSFEEAFYGKDE